MQTFSSLNSSSKKQRVDEDEECYAQLWIHHAEDIDKVTMVPNSDRRIYGVYAWVQPESSEDYFTQLVFGLPDPYWDWRCNIPVGTYEPNKYMHLEICRMGSKSDPGTSNGIIPVGKTKIRLPKPGCQISGRYGLSLPNGSDCSAAGHIIVAMKTNLRKPMIFCD